MQSCGGKHMRPIDQFINRFGKPTKICDDCRNESHFYYFCVTKDKKIKRYDDQQKSKRIKAKKFKKNYVESLDLKISFE